MDRKKRFPIGEVSKLFHISVNCIQYVETRTAASIIRHGAD